MSTGQMIIASAVIVPDSIEAGDQPISPALSTKRRQSSVSEGGSKRPRLSLNGPTPTERRDSDAVLSPTKDTLAERRASGQLEERKRGKRLFGALLGTLAQSSSSTAQKRRVDIEKKQREKLKLQAEEYDEQKRSQLDAMMEVKRQEQKKYNQQSLQIRHSNLLATANFFQTEAEPKLYYRPWELLPGDEERLRVQVEEAQATINEELSAFGPQEPDPSTTSVPLEEPTADKPNDTVADDTETVGLSTNQTEPPLDDGDTNAQDTVTNDAFGNAGDDEALKDHGDDGGEDVVEGEEDTVIY